LPERIEGRSYAIIIELKKDARVRTRSREFRLESGRYIYCGSARTNIGARIRRHLISTKRKFWHIDYLLAAGGRVIEVWTFDGIDECDIASVCMDEGATPVAGFGSSDCARCPAHLFAILDIDSNSLFSRCAQLANSSGS